MCPINTNCLVHSGNADDLVISGDVNGLVNSSHLIVLIAVFYS